MNEIQTQSAQNETSVLFAIASRFTSNQFIQEDLVQEGRIALWQSREQHPEWPAAVCYQAAKFTMSHAMQAGRSVDSRKRAALQDHPLDDMDPIDRIGTEHDVVSEAAAADIMAQLAGRCTEFQMGVLHMLLEGYTIREIGARMGVSHPIISVTSRQIREVAAEIL